MPTYLAISSTCSSVILMVIMVMVVVAMMMAVVAMAAMTLMIKEIKRSSSCSPAWPPRPPAPRSCQRSPLPLCGIAPCQQPCDSIVITMIMVAMKMVGMVMLLMVMMTITPGSTLVTFTPVPANSFLRLSLMPGHHCPSSSSPTSTSNGKGNFFYTWREILKNVVVVREAIL